MKKAHPFVHSSDFLFILLQTQKYVILINNQNFEYPSLDKLISGVSSALGVSIEDLFPPPLASSAY